MADSLRVLVVAGARALQDTPGARRWSLTQLTTAADELGADVVVHGGCAGPDLWADELAKMALLTRVVWPHSAAPHVLAYVDGAWRSKELRDAELYRYQGPLPRNAAMARWAAAQAIAGHRVVAVILRAPWSRTHGSEHARDQLRKRIGDVNVADLVCPGERGPKNDGEGQ